MWQRIVFMLMHICIPMNNKDLFGLIWFVLWLVGLLVIPSICFSVHPESGKKVRSQECDCYHTSSAVKHTNHFWPQRFSMRTAVMLHYQVTRKWKKLVTVTHRLSSYRLWDGKEGQLKKTASDTAQPSLWCECSSPFMRGPSARVLECGGARVVIHKVAHPFLRVAHLPAFWQGVLLHDAAQHTMSQTHQYSTDASTPTYHRRVNSSQPCQHITDTSTPTHQNTHQHNTLHHRYSNTTPTHQHWHIDTTLTHQSNTHISHHRHINMALMHQHRHQHQQIPDTSTWHRCINTDTSTLTNPRHINRAPMHQHRHINTNKSQAHQHGIDASTQTHQH